MSLADRFPRTFAALSALPGGLDVLEHLLHLERGFGRHDAVHIITGGGPDRRHQLPEFDVVLCGGGLSLLYAALLSRRGCKVAVLDRRRIGCGHREWNISRAELAPLVRSGLYTAAEVEALVRMQYRVGLCRWHEGGCYPVSGVLDCVIDAEGLLAGLRRRAEEAGALLLDHHQLVAYRTGPAGVALTLLHQPPRGSPGRPRELTTRLLIDGMGAHSPHARFDLCCPTVGGVMAGLACGTAPDELDPSVGEVLVTTEGVEQGRQHLWEGFPAPGGDPAGATGQTDRMTVYLFHYCEPATLGEHPLLSLYERFFATLPRYKRGELRLVRPTYGFIPAYSRLRPMPVAPRDRVLLVGDAASRHSPLTFCGFGSMIRSFLPVSEGVLRCLERDDLSRRALQAVWGEPPALRVMGGLTLMMAATRAGRRARLRDGQQVNRLLDAAFATLSAAGPEVYASFLRDEIGFADFVRFMRGTARRYPAVYRDVWSHLGVGEVMRWLLRLVSLAWAQKGISRWVSG
ncbi:MAG: lycopene cyclase [Myxococcales bacterium]|nr:lycopene cyclase [Myxococcota bacterium]MDW8283488.1 lycopene cyclase [Myxococcales bacterium]